MIARRHAPWLWLLLALFVVRVVAQPLALVTDAWLLPRFDAWHSGVLPYPALLVSQVLILTWLARTAWQFSRGRVSPRRGAGLIALGFGGVYFAVMLVRLLLGATILADHDWFARPLPTFFHLVLATYLIVYGHYHLREAPGAPR